MKKRGRPKGRYNYPDELFSQFVVREPRATGTIMNLIHQKYSKNVSWNTIMGRLDKLAVEGKIFKRRVGRYHLFRSEDF